MNYRKSRSIISLLEEQIPRYRLRADTLTQFQGKHERKELVSLFENLISIYTPFCFILEFLKGVYHVYLLWL